MLLPLRLLQVYNSNYGKPTRFQETVTSSKIFGEKVDENGWSSSLEIVYLGIDVN